MLWIRGKRLEAAERAAFRAIKVLPEEGEEWLVCRSHNTLGIIYHSKGEKEKAIHHFEIALTTASSFGWATQLFWIHHNLALLFRHEDDFDKALAHIERARSYTVDDPYRLGWGIRLQARTYYRQCRLEDAASEALRALEIFEGLGAQRDVESCKNLLRDIEQATNS